MEGEQRTLVEGILQNENDEILLLQRAEHESCAGQWQPPAGKIEYKEDPWDTVKREFYEETRLNVEPVSPPDGILNIQDYVIHDGNAGEDWAPMDDRHSIMISYRVEPVEAYGRDDVKLSEEHQTYDWVTPQEASESSKYDLVGTFQDTVELLS